MVKHDVVIMQMDMGNGQPGQAGQEGGQQVVYRCLDCDYDFPSRDAAVKHRQRFKHRCAGVDVNTGDVVDEIGKGRGGPKVITISPKKVEITNESGADIKEHVKGFVEPENETLFIYYRGGKVERFWDRFGDHESIYRALVADEKFAGSPAEFADASARYMLAVAGYEPTPCIIPKTQRQAYDETARLISEGVLKVYYDEDGKMRLELNQEKVREGLNAGDTLAESGVSARGDQHQPEGLSPQEGKEELGQP